MYFITFLQRFSGGKNIAIREVVIYYMENANTELSGRMPAFISWIQTIACALYIVSRLLFRQLAWPTSIAVALLVGAYSLAAYFDWQQGRKKAFRNRLIWLGIALVFGAIVAYIASK